MFTCYDQHVARAKRERACPSAHLRPRRVELLCAVVRPRVSHPSLHLPALIPNMSGFDADRVYSVAVHDVAEPTAPELPSQTEKLLLDFLLQYRVGGDFIYRYASLPCET